MIRCKKCKRVTKKDEPTGLIKDYRVWIDKNRTERRDILEISRVCLNCSHNLNKESKSYTGGGKLSDKQQITENLPDGEYYDNCSYFHGSGKHD